MAYGKAQKNMLRRAIPTGTTRLDASVLPVGKLGDLRILRRKYLATAGFFIDAIFSPEPLAGKKTGDEINTILIAKQKEVKDFNKAYAEKVRLAIPSAIDQVEKKYLNRLYGRLLHCAAETGEKDPAKKQYLNIPVEVQGHVTTEILKKIEVKAQKLSYNKILDLFRRVIVEDDQTGLTPTEVLVMNAIHAECLEKYRPPEFGIDPRFTCQIHLDYRVVRNKKEPVAELDNGARLLVDAKNRKYHHFLEISNPFPRGEAIRIPMVMSANAMKNFDRLSSVASLIVEIGTDEVTVKTVIAKPETETSTKGIKYLMGRDFGMVNTVSLSLVELDHSIDEDEVKRISKFSKGEALEYLQGHVHGNGNVVKRLRYSGRNFLKNIESHCSRIDRMKSQIDTGYNSLGKLKGIICGYAGLDPEEWLPGEMVFKDRFVQGLYDKFFRILKHVQKMKAIRLAIYAKIAGVKKVWFGFLSNVEILLAKTYNAAIVRENLTIEATGKETPGYKGRTFNKMINNGSKGQYIRRASDKMNWDGIPELIIPSYFTSTVCTIHALVDKAMRSGECFFCPQCGVQEHADEHASDTIANYLLLRPLQLNEAC
jgi:hypothetical protein